MARTIAEIQAEIISNVQANPELSGASSTSVTALWRLFARVVAMAIATLENLHDLFVAEVNDNIELMKPHTARWYREKCLAYIHGADLVEDGDTYPTDLVFLANSQIITAAAAVEVSGILRLKVNKSHGENYVPLSADEYAGFSAYIAEIKDAGVDVQILSANADKVRLEMNIYYDPLILAADGSRLDGTDTQPVRSAITDFLNALPFNGEFVKAYLVDAVQRVDGVFVPQIVICEATRFDNAAFNPIDVTYDPYSGFMRIYNDDDLTLNYIPNV